VSEATLAILAGGASSRMGRPKAELRVGGKPILSYLLDQFAWSGPTLLVTAPGRERPAGSERFDREVTDSAAGEGPLRGVLTALEAARTDILVVTSCDMPRVEGSQLSWLAQTLAAHRDATLLMLMRGDGRPEPLPFAVRASCEPLVRVHLGVGERSLHSLIAVSGALSLSAPSEWPASTWMNLNTPDDVTQFLRGVRVQR
jgi:molybdopterin-guanine dinucleotide biosynthesis protein A